MASNKYPWSHSILDPTKPFIFPGKVQAGSSQAIKCGELCAYNETSGYFVPVDAVADYVYSLAIAAEEQKSDDSARYMDFIAPREGDVFEFTLSAAASIELGDAVILVASQSQQLARDVDGFIVGTSAGMDNYPQEGTTLRSKSTVQAMIHPAFSYFYKNILQRDVVKVMHKTAAYTLKLEDNNATITNFGATGSVTLTAPSGVVPVGFNFKQVVAAAQAFVFDPKPDTASCIVQGAVQAAGKYVSMTDEGDFIHWVWDGTNWIAEASISGADADITIES